jgi:TetR/AcrR family transcriptional repressor of mexJK operon
MPPGKRPKTKARGPGRLSAGETVLLEARLLDSAEAVFLEQGFARATVDAIAKAAGATRKTIYARYANKEEIFDAVVRRLIDAGIQLPSIDPAMQSAAPRTRLLKLAQDLVDFVDAPQMARVNRLVFAEGYQAPQLAQLSAELYNREIDSVSAALASMKADGHLPNLPEPRIAAAMFIELVSSTARMRAMLGPGAALPRKQVETYVAGAVDLFLRGCGHKPAR